MKFISIASVIVLFMVAGVASFTMKGSSRLISSSRPLRMGLFDMFGPKKTASASHILVKGDNAVETLNRVKVELSKAKNLENAFAEKAAAISSCPSARKGGALGTFSQGQMVPAFDKVVFNEAIGVVHGPVKTPFGAHLILINQRS